MVRVSRQRAAVPARVRRLLSCVSLSDGCQTVRAEAAAMLTAFRGIGANTVRLPINPATVNTDTAVGPDWWDSYTAAKYLPNPRVYFDPMNEPHGYRAGDWMDIAATWISDRPRIPRNRIIVSGIGFDWDVKPLCADSRFDGTYLAYHHYSWDQPEITTYAGWVDNFTSYVGNCAARTILEEFGATMDSGLNYDDPTTTDVEVEYLRAYPTPPASTGSGTAVASARARPRPHCATATAEATSSGPGPPPGRSPLTTARTALPPTEHRSASSPATAGTTRSGPSTPTARSARPGRVCAWTWTGAPPDWNSATVLKGAASGGPPSRAESSRPLLNLV